MAEKIQQEAQVQTQEQEVSLLDQILTDGKMARDDFQKERAKDMIGEFVGQVMAGELTMSKNMVFSLYLVLPTLVSLPSAPWVKYSCS